MQQGSSFFFLLCSYHSFFIIKRHRILYAPVNFMASSVPRPRRFLCAGEDSHSFLLKLSRLPLAVCLWNLQLTQIVGNLVNMLSPMLVLCHAQFNCLLLHGAGDTLSDTKSARNALMAQYEFKNQRHVGERVLSWAGAGAWQAELSSRAIVVPIELGTCLIAV